MVGVSKRTTQSHSSSNGYSSKWTIRMQKLNYTKNLTGNWPIIKSGLYSAEDFAFPVPLMKSVVKSEL